MSTTIPVLEETVEETDLGIWTDNSLKRHMQVAKTISYFD